MRNGQWGGVRLRVKVDPYAGTSARSGQRETPDPRHPAAPSRASGVAPGEMPHYTLPRVYTRVSTSSNSQHTRTKHKSFSSSACSATRGRARPMRASRQTVETYTALSLSALTPALASASALVSASALAVAFTSASALAPASASASVRPVAWDTSMPCPQTQPQ